MSVKRSALGNINFINVSISNASMDSSKNVNQDNSTWSFQSNG